MSDTEQAAATTADEHACTGCHTKPTPAMMDQRAAASQIFWYAHYADTRPAFALGFLQMARQILTDGNLWDTLVGIDLLTHELIVMFKRGDYQGCVPWAKQALEIAERLPDETGELKARCLGNYGEVLLEAGDPAAAEPLLDEAVQLYNSLKLPADAPADWLAQLTARSVELVEFLSRARATLAPAPVVPAESPV
jgi:hypothetical protein